MSDQRQLMQDMAELSGFMMEKTSEFFNEKAKKVSTPAEVKECQSLSNVFGKAAQALEKMSNGSKPSMADIAALQNVEKVGNKLASKGVMAEVEEYGFNQMQEFVDADPARWARIEKNVPAVGQKVKPFLK